MGVTEGSWRLKAILFIVVMITFIYGAEALFMDIDSSMSIGDYDQTGITGNLSESEIKGLQQEESGGILGVLGGIFAFVTFGSIVEMPTWARFFLTLFVTGMVITIIYISYTFIYEFIKGLPFT